MFLKSATMPKASKEREFYKEASGRKSGEFHFSILWPDKNKSFGCNSIKLMVKDE